MAVEARSKQRSRHEAKSSKGTPPTSKTSKEGEIQSDAAPVATGKLDERLVEKAVTALLAHHAKAADESKDLLLGNDTVVQVQLGLEVAPQRAHVKPIPLNIPHGFLNGSAENGDDPPAVCLIVKQDDKAGIKELLDRFPQEMGCVKKVLGLQSLRTKYHDYARRRELLHSFDVFMADDRILPMLTAALGKIFFKAKQQPIPVDVTRKSTLPYNILKALRRTHFSWSKGTCVLVVAGRTSMEARQLVQNIAALVPLAVEKLPRKWANLKSVCIKTPSSMALPVYNKTPQELMEIARLAKLEPTYSDDPPPLEDAPTQKDDAQTKSKVERMKEKSPLLQALQKQKEKQKKAHEVSTNITRKDEVATEDDSPEAGSKKEKKKRKVKENSHSVKVENDQVEMEGEKRRLEKEEKSRKKSKMDVVGETVPSPTTISKSLPTHNKDSVRNEPSKSKSKEETSSMSSSFMPAKKYAGSKPGFVFKRGPSGVGYYADVQPGVDRMALEAILRMASLKDKSGSKSSKHHRGNNKGRGGGGRRW